LSFCPNSQLLIRIIAVAIFLQRCYLCKLVPTELQLAAEGAYSLLTLKPFTEGTVRFLGLLLKPGAQQVGEWLGERISMAKQQNIEKLAAKTKARLDALGTEPRPIPTKILVSVLERCWVEDEEEMIDRWANLLAASASGGNVPPSYLQTLATLSPIEARLLDLLSRRQTTSSVVPGRKAMDQSALRQEANLPDSEFRRAELIRLIQLGLLQRMPEKTAIERSVITMTPVSTVSLIGTTEFADDFLEVCSPKRTS
jgi:hypothetical protein